MGALHDLGLTADDLRECVREEGLRPVRASDGRIDGGTVLREGLTPDEGAVDAMRSAGVPPELVAEYRKALRETWGSSSPKPARRRRRRRSMALAQSLGVAEEFAALGGDAS